MEFKIQKCSHCGKTAPVMFSNNPLITEPVCFDCIASKIDYNNLEQAEFFCRTYNLPWNPALWIDLSSTDGVNVFRLYTSLLLDDKANQPNLYYATSTHDLWKKTNREWEKTRSFTDILSAIEPIKESYITRGRLKWGEQYTFEEIVHLDSIYSRTLKANNITNPLQKAAVQNLCKLQIEIDDAIRSKDPKAIKDFSSAYSTFAKEAHLDEMIAETKTDDITTVAELYDYMEKSGFQFTYFDGVDKDEVDRTITDIQSYLKRLVLESTGLQPLLEDMIRQKQKQMEEEYTQQVVQDTTLDDLINFNPEDAEIETEDDVDALEEIEDDE